MHARINRRAAIAALAATSVPQSIRVAVVLSAGALTFRQRTGEVCAQATAPKAGDGSLESFSVDAPALDRLLRAMPGTDVDATMNAEAMRLTLSSAGFAAKLVVGSDEDVPTAPAEEPGAALADVRAELLSVAVGSVAYAMSRDDNRRQLCGINMTAIDDRGVCVLTAMATDGKHGALRAVELSDVRGGLAQVFRDGLTLHRDGIGALLDLLHAVGHGVVRLGRHNGRLVVGANVDDMDVVLHLSSIPEPFPALRELIDQEHTGEARRFMFDQAGREALGRVMPMVHRRDHGVRLSLDRDTCTLTAESPINGSAVEMFDAPGASNGISPVMVNARILGAALDEMFRDGAPECTLSDELAPVKLSHRDRLGESVAIIMPIRVD